MELTKNIIAGTVFSSIVSVLGFISSWLLHRTSLREYIESGEWKDSFSTGALLFLLSSGIQFYSSYKLAEGMRPK